MPLSKFIYLAGVFISSFLYSKTLVDIPENQILAATLILEAGGEFDQRSMYAVYEVLQNRSQKSGRTLLQEALRRKQFSCWNDTDKQKLNRFYIAKNHPKFEFALKIVSEKHFSNYTNGATHYYADHIDPPYWTKGMTKTVTIGNHSFWK